MRAIVTAADVYEVNRCHYLVALVSHETITALVEFEAESEDRELQAEGDPDSDNALDFDCRGFLDDGEREPDYANGPFPKQPPLPVVTRDHKPVGETVELE